MLMRQMYRRWTATAREMRLTEVPVVAVTGLSEARTRGLSSRTRGKSSYCLDNHLQLRGNFIRIVELEFLRKLPVFLAVRWESTWRDRFAATASTATQSRYSGDLQSAEKAPGIPGFSRAEFTAETRNLALLATSAPKGGLSLQSRFSNLRNFAQSWRGVLFTGP
jgi:hypothetical protein